MIATRICDEQRAKDALREIEANTGNPNQVENGIEKVRCYKNNDLLAYHDDKKGLVVVVSEKMSDAELKDHIESEAPDVITPLDDPDLGGGRAHRIAREMNDEIGGMIRAAQVARLFEEKYGSGNK